LHYLLRVNPRARIYAPSDEHFGGPTPSGFYRRSEGTLPRHMRYFDGDPPQTVPHGSAWRRVRFIQVESPLEVAPGMRIIPTISSVQGTMELRELSLGIDTPTGQILLVGCSHPGIEKIVEAAAKINPRISLVAGGLHLVTTPTAEIERIATALRNRWKVERIAPGHCTGEPAFAALQRTFGEKYIYAGLGSVIELSGSGK
jgi:7,8-dihydropterin-6-yl-methyl-4-(beta-D-ribofuranosyl)aminobenzene 5'-phosphate synthase